MTTPDTPNPDSPANADQAPWRKAAVEGGTTPPAPARDPSESNADVGISDEDDGIPTGEETSSSGISPVGTVGPMVDMGGAKPKG